MSESVNLECEELCDLIWALACVMDDMRPTPFKLRLQKLHGRLNELAPEPNTE